MIVVYVPKLVIFGSLIVAQGIIFFILLSFFMRKQRPINLFSLVLVRLYSADYFNSLWLIYQNQCPKIYSLISIVQILRSQYTFRTNRVNSSDVIYLNRHRGALNIRSPEFERCHVECHQIKKFENHLSSTWTYLGR